MVVRDAVAMATGSGRQKLGGQRVQLVVEKGGIEGRIDGRGSGEWRKRRELERRSLLLLLTGTACPQIWHKVLLHQVGCCYSCRLLLLLLLLLIVKLLLLLLVDHLVSVGRAQ